MTIDLTNGKKFDDYKTTGAVAGGDKFLMSKSDKTGTNSATADMLKAYIIGNISGLKTADKDNVIAAINELVTNISANADKISAMSEILTNYNNTGMHNSIYRGKYLGTSVTDSQYSAILSGEFTDMYIGDYWTIGGVNWRIAAFDYYLHTGDTECTTHHATIVPDTSLYRAQMNTSNTTAGAYVGSAMYTSNLATAKATINNAFGSSHVLNHRNHLQNAATNGYETGGSWYDSTVELMTEQNLYGGKIFTDCTQGTNWANLYTVDKSQYPLFAMDPTKINIRDDYWLRGVARSTDFASCGASGNAYGWSASSSFGVRPAFSIY